MKIIVLGAGVQGTLYGVRLARRGHDVTFVARGSRATELRERGAAIREAFTERSDVINMPVIERFERNLVADIALITVRREQLDAVLPELAAASGIARFVFFVNHANGSASLFDALGRARVVLGFPGAAGALAGAVDRYVEVREQPTAIEATAPDLAAILRDADFRVELVPDMDSWLRRHAVFVTAIAGALSQVEADPQRLADNPHLVRAFIVGIREGWAALDRRNVAPASRSLRAIFCWVPLPLAVLYWRRLLRSPRGDLYFAAHTRHMSLPPSPMTCAALSKMIRRRLSVISMRRSTLPLEIVPPK